MQITSDLFNLDTVKKHLRILHNHEDALLDLYADAVLIQAALFCGYSKIVSENDTASANDLQIDANITTALLLILDDIYTKRANDDAPENVRLTGNAAKILWQYRRNFGV